MSEYKSGQPKRIKPSGPVFPNQAGVIADAIDRLGAAIREAFGPPKEELRIAHSESSALTAMYKRVEEAADMLEQVRGHGYPQAVAPPPEGAPLYELLNALRPLVYRVVNATAADDAELTENVDVIMAFVDLAREHPDPKRLLPRGDRLGDWLSPGTPVVVHLGDFEHPGVVEPTRDLVTVRLERNGAVAEFSRNVVTKEGEPWTPPKHTSS